MADDYGIPHSDIIKLKKELGDSKQNKTLQETMEELTKAISSLVDLFKVAAEELKLEEHDSVLISEKVAPLMKKINDLEQQNEKIAKGIVALADMMKGQQRPMMRPQGPRPFMQTPLPPREPGFSTQIPSPEMKPLPTVQPMPQQPQQKKSLFGFKK